MNKSTGSDQNPAKKAADNQAEAARFVIKGQYVKDLSFENPHSPQSLLPTKEKPKIEVSIDLKANKLQDDLYETAISISTKAEAKDGTLFLIELVYAGLFAISNLPEERLEPVLFIDAPFILFPFARRVIADITRDGGFPPLMLEPIDFAQMYQEKKKLQQKKAS